MKLDRNAHDDPTRYVGRDRQASASQSIEELAAKLSSLKAKTDRLDAENSAKWAKRGAKALKEAQAADDAAKEARAEFNRALDLLCKISDARTNGRSVDDIWRTERCATLRLARYRSTLDAITSLLIDLDEDTAEIAAQRLDIRSALNLGENASDTDVRVAIRSKKTGDRNDG